MGILHGAGRGGVCGVASGLCSMHGVFGVSGKEYEGCRCSRDLLGAVCVFKKSKK